MKTNLTVHSVVKNEPFIYYSIKSVYDYCDEILLYDTGSTDKNTLMDIENLLIEDKKHKIKFKKVTLGFDEEKWSLDGLKAFISNNKGRMSVGKCRQMQIDETKTKYFMLVDGDEIHYKHTMELIINNLLPNFPKNKLCVGLPLIWFYNLNTTFTTKTFPVNGRIFVTDKIYMNDESPNEQHLIKGSNEKFTYNHPAYLTYNEATPYVHYETVIRPWRRKFLVPKDEPKLFTGKLPEVILEQPYYLERFKRCKQI